MFTGLGGKLADGKQRATLRPSVPSCNQCCATAQMIISSSAVPELHNFFFFFSLLFAAASFTFSTCEGCTVMFLPPLEIKHGSFVLRLFALLVNINANTPSCRRPFTHLAHVLLCSPRPTDHPQRQRDKVHSDVQVHHPRRFGARQQQQRHPGGHVRVGSEELVPLFQAVRRR